MHHDLLVYLRLAKDDTCFIMLRDQSPKLLHFAAFLMFLFDRFVDFNIHVSYIDIFYFHTAKNAWPISLRIMVQTG